MNFVLNISKKYNANTAVQFFNLLPEMILNILSMSLKNAMTRLFSLRRTLRAGFFSHANYGVFF